MITSISNNASSLPISGTPATTEKTDGEVSFAAALQQAAADITTSTAASTASTSAEATATTEASAVSAEQAQIAASIAAWKAATESYMPSLKRSTSDAIASNPSAPKASAPKASAPKASAPKASTPTTAADQDLTSLVAQAKQTSIDLNDMIERALQFASTKQATNQSAVSASTDVKTVAANEQIVQNDQAKISAPTRSPVQTQSPVTSQPITLTDMINKLNQESINMAKLDSSKTAATRDLLSAASTSLTQSVAGYDQLKIMMEKINNTQKS